MLQYCSLYSGSTGNSFLIKSTYSNILIDVGVSLKKLIEGLRKLWFRFKPNKCYINYSWTYRPY